MLFIDLGHSRLKWRCGAQSAAWPLQQWLQDPESLLWPETDSVAWISVLNESINQRLLAQLQRQFTPQSIVRLQTQAQHRGITNAYTDPSGLGVDRWMALLGAGFHSQQATVVVDAGTALTLDWLDETGQHRGGWIMAGRAGQQAALRAISEQLPETDAAWDWRQSGRDTASACRLGSAFALAGGVDRTLALWFSAEDNLRLLLTGGDAELIQQGSAYTWEHRPHLIWEGMQEALS